MTSSLRTGLSVLILILACSCSKDNPAYPPLGKDAVILAFGDSLTYGTGAAETQSYPAMLSQLTGREVINAGIPGEVTADGSRRLPALLDKHIPELLILCHGGNDLLRKLNPDKIRANLESMIENALQRSIPVVLIGVPELGIMFLESAPVYATLASKYQLLYEGEILPELESDNDLKSDRIHPNADGYKLMAKAVYNLLQQSGAVN
jgi:acyl-CoA thioesterase-1